MTHWLALALLLAVFVVLGVVVGREERGQLRVGPRHQAAAERRSWRR